MRLHFPRLYFIFAVCFFSSAALSSAQVAKNDGQSPRCCYPVKSEATGNIGFIDETGRLVVPANISTDTPSVEFEPFEHKFSEGLAPVEVGGSWGFIDREGRMKIAPAYSSALNFSEGLAAVDVARRGEKWEKGEESRWGFIDKEGRMRIAPAYSAARSFSPDGLAAVVAKGAWKFIDKEGRVVLSPAYSQVLDFSEGLAAVRLKNGRLGFIDRQGAQAVSTEFEFVESTDNSIPSTFKGTEYEELGYYSPYEERSPGEPPRFSEGLYPVRVRGKWGHIDRQGKIRIAPRFDAAGNFHEGAARVKVGRDFGFIDVLGKYVIAPRFRYADDFSNGLALVFFSRSYKTRGSMDSVVRRHAIVYGYVDRKGRAVFRGRNTFVTEMQGGDYQEVFDFPPQVDVTIRSSPEKAKIYLIPLSDLTLNEGLLKDERSMSAYMLPEETEFKGRIIQQVYVVVLEYQGKRIQRRLDANDRKANRVDVSFDRQ
jgi:WG containing repeat